MSRDDLTPDERAQRDAERKQRDAAAKRVWNASHRDYKRDWRITHRDEVNLAERQRARRRRADQRARRAARERDAQYREAHREAERERGRKLRREHPERVQQYKQRYREKHPERAAAQARQASTRYRDRNAERLREQARLSAAERRKAQPGQFNAWYARNIDKERERNRAASRLRSRLRALELPPKRTHRTYASDRRANQTDADAFFARDPRKDPALAQRLEREALGSPGSGRARAWLAIKAGWDGPTPPQAIALFTRMSALYRLHAKHQRETHRHRSRIERTLGSQIREEVRLDAVARNARRGPPVDVEREVDQRLEELTAQAAHKTKQEVDAAARDALTHAIRAAQDPGWWETVERHQLAELMSLTQTRAADTEKKRETLARLLDRGCRIAFGLPVANLLAGRDPGPAIPAAATPRKPRSAIALRAGVQFRSV